MARKSFNVMSTQDGCFLPTFPCSPGLDWVPYGSLQRIAETLFYKPDAILDVKALKTYYCNVHHILHSHAI